VGSIVLDPSVRDQFTRHAMERDERGYFLRNGDAEYQVLKHFGVQISQAAPDIAYRLSVDVGSEVITRSRVLGKPANRKEGQNRPVPMLLSTTYLPGWLAEVVPAVKLEDAGPGGIEDRIEEHFQQPLGWEMYGSAAIATPDQSVKLSAANQDALLRMQRVAKLPDGRAVEIVDQYGAATNFEIYYPIPRAVSAQWSGAPVGE
jgi:GntR family transcriptional regulator